MQRTILPGTDGDGGSFMLGQGGQIEYDSQSHRH
jgi:hypothetical protein